MGSCQRVCSQEQACPVHLTLLSKAVELVLSSVSRCLQACTHVSKVHGESQGSSELQILCHSPSNGCGNLGTVLQQPQSLHW